MKKPIWEKETDLCADFIKWAEHQGWVVYSETAGWDMILVRPQDGFQIGIEAKLKLNATVLCQVLEKDQNHHRGGPDVHAILVPEVGKQIGLETITRRLEIAVITGDEHKRGHLQPRGYTGNHFYPALPTPDQAYYRWEDWPERCPDKRVDLPDYVPDTITGDKAPVKLTDWKIRAIKIAVIIEIRGSVTRADFKALKIDFSRWGVGAYSWLRNNNDGGWVPTDQCPNFKAQHPVNYEQIKADYPEWSKLLPARLK